MLIYNQKFFQIKNVPNIPKKMGTFSENIMFTSWRRYKSYGRFT